jgi:predicted lipoprotein with Yx(FWY)xxD motif
VPPRVLYGMACLIIRDAVGSVPCLDRCSEGWPLVPIKDPDASKGWPLVPTKDPGPGEDLSDGLEFHLP